MQQTQKLESLGVLAGGVAHDFNNLLMGIIGHAELVLRDKEISAVSRENVLHIETAAKRAAELTKQMLDYSGKGRFIVEPLDLSLLMREMAHLLEVSLVKKAVLKYELVDNLPAIEADATQVRQIVMNLIINASEALGDKSGVITLSSGTVNCGDPACQCTTFLGESITNRVYVYLQVADTGCGMDEETRSKIFDPFFTTKFTGRGLGLAAVLGIVRGHKGAVQLKSVQGEGTEFRVLFPASNKLPAKRKRTTENQEFWRGSGTILVIDDKETVRNVAKDMLEHLGFQALIAKSSPDGLKLYEKHHSEIVLVLLDLTMPVMGGKKVFEVIHGSDPDSKVVLMSGYSEQEATSSFVGLSGFLQKPFHLSDLQEMIRQILGPDKKARTD